MLDLRFLTYLLASLISISVRAEVLSCKGTVSTASPPINIEVSVDMDKGKSFLRWVNPDDTGITQGQSMNRRKYQGTTVKYLDQGSSTVFLEVPVANSPQVKGNFTHIAQQLNAVPMTCDLFGTIPATPACPKNKDAALLRAMDTAQTVDEVEYLLQCGANPNVLNAKGCTPLMLAIDPDCHPGLASGLIPDVGALIDLFLNNGAYVDIQDRKGETALIKTARNGIQNVSDSFLAAAADYNLKDKSGNTALMYAANDGDKWLIQDILEGDPDRRLKNRAGKTAYDIAKQYHDQETADLVRIPDLTVLIAGQADGSCSPLTVKVKVGQALEIALQATDKMFRLQSPALGLDVMADSGLTVKKIVTLSSRGDFAFTCGFHGTSSTSPGVISVQ